MSYLRYFKASEPGADPLPGDHLITWWTGLKDHQRGALAELRRCEETTDVAFVPAFHSLLQRLPGYVDKDGLARVAMLSAFVRNNVKGNVAGQLAARRGEGPVFSELRMRRLLSESNADEVLLHLRRAIKQIDGTCDLLHLADSVYHWTPETRKDWAYTYFSKS